MKKITLTITLLLMTFVSFTVVFGDTLAQESQFNNITIFIRFNDEQDYEAPYGLSHYEDMLNGVDQPSLRNYYLEASYGSLTIDSYIPTDNGSIIYYTDIYDRSYFEPVSGSNPNGVGETEQADREHGLLKRALDYVEQENLVPDEMNLDVNEDGMIDSLTFMVSGEDSGWSSLLWPHKWELYTFYNYSIGFTADAPEINGVNAYTYTFELLGNSQSYYYQVDVGVLAHETFHLLGAPDLYHYYSYFDINPVGDWGLMESNGTIPSHMLGYMKEHYAGWISNVNEITESGTYTLYPLQDSSSNIYRIFTGVEDQWIYLEYRDTVGFYESNLPYSGLLVYRVNLGLEGNETGSYDENGNPTDEVFIFRPGMSDTTDPIVIIDDDVDGQIDMAALTDYLYYEDEMGVGTNIPMFLSDGTVINMGIYNVTEEDGYITFEVVLEPQIELLSDNHAIKGKSVVLYDSNLMDYNVKVSSLKAGQTAYYTLDGTTPDTNSTLYTPGSTFQIDALNNTVKVAIYDGTELIQILEKEYEFSSSIESEHDPYRDNMNLYFYLDFGTDVDFSIEFDNRSELELDYDYVTVDVDGTNETFTGTDMRTYSGDFYQDEFLIHLDTDAYVNEYYGFLIDLQIAEFISVNLFGEDEITISVFDSFTDPGAELSGTEVATHTLEVSGEVNTDVIGTYVITYTVLDALDQVVFEDTRTVNVVDDEAPELDLIGPSEIDIEVNSNYVDQYITYSDNYDNDLTITIIGEVDENVLGTYMITYVVRDQSNNSTTVRRTVNVVDTTAPEVELIGLSDINVEVNGEYVEQYITYSDNFDTNLAVEVVGDVNTNAIASYTITYTVTDASGNSTMVERIVNVVDTTAPEVELIGLSEMDIEVHNSFTDQHITFIDNFDSDLTVVVVGEVDVHMIGTYTITYTVTDQSSNETIVERTINIIDTTAPIGILNPGVDTIATGEAWIDAGVYTTDNYNVDLDLEITGEVNTNEDGDYLIFYDVSDSSGNEIRFTRIVTVVSTLSAPEFSCSDMVTTLSTEDELDVLSCYVGETEAQVEVPENSLSVGIHEIVYFVEIDGVRYEHSVFYFVYEAGTTINEVAFIERRKQI